MSKKVLDVPPVYCQYCGAEIERGMVRAGNKRIQEQPSTYAKRQYCRKPAPCKNQAQSGRQRIRMRQPKPKQWHPPSEEQVKSIGQLFREIFGIPVDFEPLGCKTKREQAGTPVDTSR